jgi:hypothetical protein
MSCFYQITKTLSFFESSGQNFWTNSMNDIRTKSLKVPNLKEAWIKSVEPLKRILEDRTSRLKLKKDPFVVHSAANAGLYNNFFSNLSLWASNFLD